MSWKKKLYFYWSMREHEEEEMETNQKETRKQQVARKRASGEVENRAHKSLDFDPAARSDGW